MNTDEMKKFREAAGADGMVCAISKNEDGGIAIQSIVEGSMKIEYMVAMIASMVNNVCQSIDYKMTVMDLVKHIEMEAKKSRIEEAAKKGEDLIEVLREQVDYSPEVKAKIEMMERIVGALTGEREKEDSLNGLKSFLQGLSGRVN